MAALAERATLKHMTETELRSAVLALPRDERAALAHELLTSLDGRADPDADEAWLRELERRAREVRDGTAALVDWDDAKARISARLRALREDPTSR